MQGNPQVRLVSLKQTASQPDVVARALAIAALGISLFNAIIGRLDVRRKRAAKPDESLRPTLSAMCRTYAAVAAGAPRNRLWSATATSELEQLDELVDSIADRKLRRACAELVTKGQLAAGASPPSRLDAYDQRAAQPATAAAAAEAVAAAQIALERLNQLVRRSP
jgi:hypothetical protein